MLQRSFYVKRILILTAVIVWGSLLLFRQIKPTAARYKTSAASTVSVRVASLSLDVSDPVCVSADEVLDCNLQNDEIRYEFDVVNRSEVVMNYTVTTSGGNENVRFVVSPSSGELSALDGSETITVVLSVIDPELAPMEETIEPVLIEIRAEQKGASP